MPLKSMPLEDDIRTAREHVSLGRRQIAQQRKRIAELGTVGAGEYLDQFDGLIPPLAFRQLVLLDRGFKC